MKKMVKVLEVNTDDECCCMIVLPYGSPTSISIDVDSISNDAAEKTNKPKHIIKENIKKKNVGKFLVADVLEDRQMITFPEGQIKY